MALADQLGVSDPTTMMPDLISQREPDLAQNGTNPNVLMDRLIHRTMDAQRQKQAQPAAPPFNSSSYGRKEGEAAPPFNSSDYGVKPDEAQAPPAQAPPAEKVPWSDLPHIGVQSAAKGAIQGLGGSIEGLGIASDAGRRLSADLQSGAQAIDPYSGLPYDTMNPDATPAKPNIQGNSIYKAGKSVSDFGEKTYPLTPAEQDTITAKVGGGAGGLIGMLPGIAAGSVLGGPVGGMVAGGAQMGLAGAASTFDDAVSKGADETTAAKAAGIAGPVDAVLGSLPLGVFLRPIEKAAPGLMGYAASKLAMRAAEGGGSFAGIGEAQEWLAGEIQKDFYPEDPKNPQSPYVFEGKRVAANAITGALGGLLGGVLHKDQQAQGKGATDQTQPGDQTQPQPGTPPGPGPLSDADLQAGMAAAQQAAGGVRPPPGAPPAPGEPPISRNATPEETAAWQAHKQAADDAFEAFKKQNGEEYDYTRTPGPNGEQFRATPRAPPQPDPTDPNSQTHEERVKQYQDFERDREEARQQQRQADAQAANATPADQRRRAALERSAAYYNEFKPGEIASWSDAKLKDYVTQKTTKPADDDEVLKRAGVGQAEAAAMSPEEKAKTADEARGYGVHAGEEPPVPGTREAPVELRTGADVARAAAVASQDHTPAQGEANNVRNGHAVWPPGSKDQLGISIQAPGGGVRRGTAPETGEPWETTHPHAYGEFKDLPDAADGMKPDVIIGDHPGAPLAYVIDEVDPKTGKYRQSKSFIGFQSPDAARQSYLGISSKSAAQIGGMRSFPRQEFVDMARAGGLSKPVAGRPAGGAGAPAYNVSDQGTAPAGGVDLKVNGSPHGPEHVDAVEGALWARGVDPAKVDPADIDRAAKIHAEEGAPPDQAFPVAVLRNLVDAGEISRAAVEKSTGNAAENVLGPVVPPQRQLRPETRSASPGGPAPAAEGGVNPRRSEAGKAAEAGRPAEPAGTDIAQRGAQAAAGPEGAGGGAGGAGREPTAGSEPAGAERAAGAEAAGNAEPAKASKAAVKAPKDQSLLQFLASRGGIRSDDPLIPDLQSILGRNNHFVPGHGNLIRQPKQLSTADRMGGKHAPMSLDTAREAAVEAGYVHDAGALTGAKATSTVRTLLDHIEEEARGKKQYSAGREPEGGMTEAQAASQEARNDDLAKAQGKLTAALKKEKYPLDHVIPEDMRRTTELMVDHGLDPLVAFERAVMEGEQSHSEGMVEPHEKPYIDLEDLGHANAPERSAAHAQSEVPARESNERAEGNAVEIPEEGGSPPDAGESAGERPEPGTAAAGPEPEPGPVEPRAVAAAGERGAVTERTVAGQQSVLPGAERISDRELAQRRADTSLKPKKAQKPADEGLFGDESKQADLLDMARKLPPEKPAAPVKTKEAPETGPSDSGRLPGFSEPGSDREPLSFVDLGEYKTPEGAQIGHAAQRYVVEQGRTTGLEHLLAFDRDGTVVAHGRGTADGIAASSALKEATRDPNRAIVVHHNHPSNTGLSNDDIGMLGLHGQEAVWVHGNGGLVARGALTGRARIALSKLSPDEAANRLYAVARRIDRTIEGAIRIALGRGAVTTGEADAAIAHLVAATLDRAEILDYRSNVDASDFVARAGLEPYLEGSARLAARSLFNGEPTHRIDQRAAALRQHPGDLGTIFGDARTPAEWHDVQSGEDQGHQAPDRGTQGPSDNPEDGEPPSGFADNAPPFYSAVAKTIESAKQDKAAPNHWLGMLKNAPGVKPEEMQWLGLDDWLRDHKGPVTKQEIADYVRANQVEVKEVEKGGAKAAPQWVQTGDEWASADGYRIVPEGADFIVLNPEGRRISRVDSVEQAQTNHANAYRNRPDNAAATKFSSYALPGGENYRELLLTLPPDTGKFNALTFNQIAKRLGYGGWSDRLNTKQKDHVERLFDQQSMKPTELTQRMNDIEDMLRGANLGEAERAGLRQEYKELADTTREQPTFKSPHWDEPNVLAHVRFDDRVIDGKRALHVAEIQSDWMQSMRRSDVARQKAIEDNFLGITLAMEKAGRIKIHCD